MSEIKTAVILFALFTVIFGLIYPLTVTGISQLVFPFQANGELIKENGTIVGSELIGQNFSSPQYFHGRPSVIDYNASTSMGSNLGPTNKLLINNVTQRMQSIIQENYLPVNSTVPSDLVEASASGLDPNIDLNSALIQVPRIAQARNISESEVKKIVMNNEEYQYLYFGAPMVNVLKLNIALDKV